MSTLGLTCIFLFLGFTAPAEELKSNWTDPDNWQKLQKWMVPQQVITVLGNPLLKDFNLKAGIWYYQDVPKITEGTKIVRPDYGIVRFGRANRGGYIVLDWKEPDWEKLAAQKKRDPNSVPLSTEEQLEAARKELERLAEEKKLAEEKAKQAELARQRAIKEQQSKKFGWLDKKNFRIGAAILLGIIGIFVIFSKAYEH